MYALLTEATDGSFALPVLRVVNSLDRETVESDGHVVALRYLTPAQRRAFGWFDFTEEAVAAGYTAGAPVDALDGDVVRRSYPGKQLYLSADRLDPSPDNLGMSGTMLDLIEG